MEFAVVTMPKSRRTTRILFDGVIDESLPFSSTYTSTINNEATILENTTMFDSQEPIITSTPYPILDITSKFLKILKNPMEQSILKNSQRRKSKNTDSKKKVFFISPEIVEISTIDEKMKKSFKEEQKKLKASITGCSLPKETPIRQHKSKIRPRLLNFTESASKLDTKKQQTVEARVKRLVGGKKTSPILQQQEKAKDAEGFLKGVKLNRRFELLMKHLAAAKSSAK
ncbi:hypothetical protein ACKWTF_014372 [Chironomus riparius]